MRHLKRATLALLLAAVAFALFGLLTATLRVWAPIDTAALQLAAHWQSGFGRWLATLIGLGGDLYLLSSLSIALLWWGTLHGKGWHLFSLVTLLLGAEVITGGLKFLIGRPRPLVGQLLYTGPAYPSGHTLLAVIFFGWLFLLLWQHAHHHRRWWLSLLVVGVFAVALSRVYLLAHYLTDVVASILLGLAWLCVVISGELLFFCGRHLVPPR